MVGLGGQFGDCPYRACTPTDRKFLAQVTKPQVFVNLAGLIRVASVFEPRERSQIILFPPAIARFEPEKSSYADSHNGDINGMVNGKKHEVIGENQRYVNQRANSKDQQMHHNTDF